ncbi:MAG TPA: hypothetical protein VMH39_00560, partial [Gemmatimonadaceae bacterium]|nr:hypothetical protein [Gemmatimonadaceae bacterium]
ARGIAAPGEEVTIHATPPARGWVAGTVAIDPDELAADDIRYFAAWIGTPPAVVVKPGAGPFLNAAVDVLRRSGALGSGDAVSVGPADELDSLPAFIVAPSDPVRLGVANRALERAGVAWRFGARRVGARAAAQGAGIGQVDVRDRYDLVPEAGAVAETLAAIGRDPWIVAGPRFVLVGSPVTADATTLPVAVAFIPWLSANLRDRLGGEPGGVVNAVPGSRIPRPAWAAGLESPDGRRTTLGDDIDVPAVAGTYFLVNGARRVGALVVNAAPEESNLDRLTPAELAGRITSPHTEVLANPVAFPARMFTTASRRSLVDPLLVAALAALLAEGLVVTARSRERTV